VIRICGHIKCGQTECNPIVPYGFTGMGLINNNVFFYGYHIMVILTKDLFFGVEYSVINPSDCELSDLG